MENTFKKFEDYFTKKQGICQTFNIIMNTELKQIFLRKYINEKNTLYQQIKNTLLIFSIQFQQLQKTKCYQNKEIKLDLFAENTSTKKNLDLH